MWYLLDLSASEHEQVKSAAFVDMLYIAGVVLVGVIASFLFAKEAVRKGYKTGTARRYPFIATGVAVFFMLLAQTATIVIGSLMGAARGAYWANIMHLCLNVFIIALFLAVLYIAYKNMKAAPHASEKRKQVDSEDKSDDSET